MRILLALFVLIAPAIAKAGIVVDFNDIEFWVGTGANEAGFVVDWDGTQSFAWGYRWDGDATGEDMFMSIVGSDPRLFAKISLPGAFGVSPYGIGYDDGDGNFAISDGTVFDANGFSIDSALRDDANALDADDLYEEGWFSEGFWSYWVNDGNPYDGGSWDSPLFGMSDRSLADGDWDGWSYAPGFNGVAPAAAFSASVPEPGAGCLLACGLLLFVRHRFRD